MNTSPTTRRAALAALAMPLAAESAVNTDAIGEVITLAAEKNAAFMRGDMEGWVKLVRIAPDFILMQPFGGPASHGFDVLEAQREVKVARATAQEALTQLQGSLGAGAPATREATAMLARL